MEFHTRLRRFISGKKSSLFLILLRAIGLFNHRQDCSRPRKGKGHRKDHAPIALQLFSPSLSKRSFSLYLPSSFFRLYLPSIPMSSINSYPNGTPINNREQALEAQRLHELSRSGQDYSRRYIGFARSHCRDAQGIYWGSRYNLLKNIKVAGQTRLQRNDMAAKMKRHGLLDRSGYEAIKMFIKSLKYLHKRDDLLFFIDSRVYSFFGAGLDR